MNVPPLVILLGMLLASGPTTIFRSGMRWTVSSNSGP